MTRPIAVATIAAMEPGTHPHLILASQPDLRDPTLVIAWAGWNDAGEAASHAVRYLAATMNTDKFASIDPEDYYDFTDVRPLARYRNGHREITWPSTDFYAVRRDNQPRDLILGVGIEPNHRWKSYMEAIASLATTMHVGLVVTLGAVAAAVPHTRPIHVTGSATTTALTTQHRMRPPGYEGPTGIVGVFHDYCRRQQRDAVSLWASVPHYLPGIVNPHGARALLEALTPVCDLAVDYTHLEKEHDRFTKQVNIAVNEDDELADYVRRLEEAQPDEAPPAPPAELPTSEALIDELEDFLRQRRNED